MGFAQNLIAGVGSRTANVIGKELGAFALGPKKYTGAFLERMGGATDIMGKWSRPGIIGAAQRGLEAVGITSVRKAAEKVVPWAISTAAVAGVNTLVWGSNQPQTGQTNRKTQNDIKDLKKTVDDLQKQLNKVK